MSCNYAVQDHSCFLGRRAEDCQEGPENPENQRQDSHKVELLGEGCTLLFCASEKYF
jgi:hypothetical protein